jgi:hypothetical protein
MYARTNRGYNERDSRTNYVRSSIPHCIDAIQCNTSSKKLGFSASGYSRRCTKCPGEYFDLPRHSTELHYKQIHYCILQTVLSVSSKEFRRRYIELSTGWFVAFVLCLVFKNDHHISGTGFVFILIWQLEAEEKSPIELSPTSITGCYYEYIKQAWKLRILWGWPARERFLANT